MTKDILFLIAGLLAYVQSVATGLETVWVRDVTAHYQANKRGLSVFDLPNQLTFHLKRGLDDVTLNLKRNYAIDQNADIYVVQTKDARPFLSRTNEVEEEAIAYYQDKDNGAYMTVRCVKRSNHKCDRVINGNIRIGDYDYYLRPLETDVTSSHMSEVPSLIEKRYVLLDEANIGIENTVENYDMVNVSETNLEEELNDECLQYFTGKGKHNHFLPLHATLPQYATYLQDKRIHDETRQPRHQYYVKVAVLIDSGVWQLYSTRVHIADPIRKNEEVKRVIREAFSHIMNSVNLRYKGIDDPSISIEIILQNFVFFQEEFHFPHNHSKVVIVNGKKHIDVRPYLYDIFEWVKNVGTKMVPPFDHAMLFTTYELYQDFINDTSIFGLSPLGGVCSAKFSVIQATNYHKTVQTAAHELGHNLGANHDGTADAVDCKAEDFFIMSPCHRRFNETTPYTRNPWIFSNCSVRAFKRTLISKSCVQYNGFVYDTNEWMMFMKKEPGDVFTPNEQCWLLYGPNFVHYGAVDEGICHLLKCLNRKTRKYSKKYIYAARGTKCGNNMWCIEGRCVSK